MELLRYRPLCINTQLWNLKHTLLEQLDASSVFSSVQLLA